MPALFDEEITATYAGLRAAIDHGDYLIDVDPTQRYVLVGGIRSTGLTAGMAIAEHVMDLLADAGSTSRRAPNCRHRRGCPTSAKPSPGPTRTPSGSPPIPPTARIVCFCERVTAGEIRDAFASAIPPADLDGLRRRTRVMNGRCQGFYCGADAALLEPAAPSTPPERRRLRSERSR